jgi:peptidoglycan/LPS O-acetylase OafA/YrhL
MKEHRHPAVAGAAPVAPPPNHDSAGQSPVRTEIPTAAARERIAILDALRLTAALMVVSYHFISRGDVWATAPPHGFPMVVYLLSRCGLLGVELFFLISGFVICMSGMGRSAGEFFVARFIRLYPAYWFAVLFTAAVVTLWPTVAAPPSLAHVVINLTMLQAPLHVPDVDGVYWTLWVELRFYLLFGIAVFCGLTYRRVVAFCVLWTVATIALTMVGGADSKVGLMFIPQCAPYFIAGMVFSLMYRFGPNALLWTIVAIQFLLALRVDSMIHDHFADLPPWIAPAFIVVLFALVALVALRKLTVGWRWLTVAGALTYPLYLLHQRIGWILIERLQHIAPAPVVAAAVAVLMLTAAWLVHRWVERPMAGLMRRAVRVRLRKRERAARLESV